MAQNFNLGGIAQYLTVNTSSNVITTNATLSFTNTAQLNINGSVGANGQALISNGTAIQWGTVSPGYNYSSQFNGSTQYLSSSTTNALAFGTGDYTVECWFYLSNTSGSKIIIEGSATNAFFLRYGTSYGVNNGLGVGKNNVSDNEYCSYTFVTNTWYHVAVVRQSNVIKFFVNGVQQTTVGTGTSSFSYGNETTTLMGGTTSVEMFAGNISNLRVLKGTALYTANFTPPTSPLSAISGTSLLTCNAITPSDSSTNNFQITNNNGVTTTATQSPFTLTTVSIPTQSITSVRQQFTGDGSTTSFSVAGGYTANSVDVYVNGIKVRNGTDVTVTSGASVVFAVAPPNGSLIDVVGSIPTTYSSITPVSYSVGFNGTNQSLSTLTSTIFGYGTGDFTIEFWLYLNALGTVTVLSNLQSTAGLQPHLYLNSGALTYYTSSAARINGATLTTGVWYHIALVRASGSTKLYLNGTQTGSTYSDTNDYGSSNPICISDYYTSYPTRAGSGMNGYVSNVRVVKGLAVYTNNFTVPSSPLAITQLASGSYIQPVTGTQTSLLTCNGPTIVDSSTNALTITNNGTATVSTSIVPTFTSVTINTIIPTDYSPSFLLMGA